MFSRIWKTPGGVPVTGALRTNFLFLSATSCTGNLNRTLRQGLLSASLTSQGRPQNTHFPHLDPTPSASTAMMMMMMIIIIIIIKRQNKNKIANISRAKHFWYIRVIITTKKQWQPW